MLLDNLIPKNNRSRKNLVPSHIYAAIREYYSKGYTKKKIAGMVKKEFPGDIKISDTRFNNVVYNVMWHEKKKGKTVEKEEVSNVHPPIYKSERREVGSRTLDEVLDLADKQSEGEHWNTNLFASLTSERGDIITVEFAPETVRNMLKEIVARGD